MSGPAFRGFDYALEPVRTQRAWQLDRELQALALAQRGLLECKARRADLGVRYDTQVAQARAAWMQRCDATVQAHSLRFLALLQEQMAVADADIESSARSVGEAQTRCARAQTRLEVLNEHRTEELCEHRQEVQRRSSAQADREWSARAASRTEDIL